MTTIASNLDPALKAKHRAMWASGDYARVAREVVGELGPVLVSACRVRPGEEVLDVAAGTGNASRPAAAAGARVLATDLTPELLDLGRADAEAAGVDLGWETADAEALPYADGSFDVVMSCLGVMFAPHHQAAADELVRVCRTGGRIGLLSWTPEGFIGQMFATMRPFVGPPPPGVQPPPLWGNESHVAQLLGDRVHDLVAERRSLSVAHFPGPSDLRDYFSRSYGPTIAAYRALADDPARTGELDQALDELAGRFREADGTMAWEYLLVTVRRR